MLENMPHIAPFFILALFEKPKLLKEEWNHHLP